MTDNNNKALLFLHSEEGTIDPRHWASRMSDLRGEPLIDPRAEQADFAVFCFSMNSGRVVFGIRLQELDDSYLVALPALLFADEAGIHGRSLVAETVIRLFKSSLGFVCRAPEEQGYFYSRYIYGRRDSAPEFFTKERLAALERTLANKPTGSAMASALAAHSAQAPVEDDEGDEDPAQAWKNLPYNKNTRH